MSHFDTSNKNKHLILFVAVKDEDTKKQDKDSEDNGVVPPSSVYVTVVATPATTDEFPADSTSTFKFQELASATTNFKQECLLGESEFGKVFKGTLPDGKVVAIKKLDTHGTKANKEFIKEVIKLRELHHPNLVELLGHCVDGDQILLVYKYMQMGSIKDHMHDLPPGKKPLDWITRMKVVVGVAKAIEYLHEKINPPVLCRNIKSTNVLLDENFNPKVGDYGLANLEISSSISVQERVTRSVGVAPEYEYKGELSLKSDVYSFGVIILELITGRKALDTSLPTKEQNLVSWAKPYFKDPKRFHELADPMFKEVVPEKILNQAVGVSARCLQEDPVPRPLISDIVGALNFLIVAPLEGLIESPPTYNLPTSALQNKYSSSSSSSSSSDSDSEHELDFKIEPFNRPEPESVHEYKLEHEWESGPETDLETEPEQEPEPEPEPDADLDTSSDSESDTKSEPEPEPKPEPEPEHDLDTDSDSESDTESEPEVKLVDEAETSTSHKDLPDSDSKPEQIYKPEQVVKTEELISHKDQPNSDHDSNSTSGSIYDEDAYSEEDFSDEDKPSTSVLLNSRSKARIKTKPSKRKVMFNTEETNSIKPNMQRVNLSKKSLSNSNNQPIKRKNTSKIHNSDSRRDDIEFTDGSDDEFEPQRFKSTISRFTTESRCYSTYQDGSSSDDETHI